MIELIRLFHMKIFVNFDEFPQHSTQNLFHTHPFNFNVSPFAEDQIFLIQIVFRKIEKVRLDSRLNSTTKLPSSNSYN